MRVYITGHKGQLGRALHQRLPAADGADLPEVDISHPGLHRRRGCGLAARPHHPLRRHDRRRRRRPPARAGLPHQRPRHAERRPRRRARRCRPAAHQHQRSLRRRQGQPLLRVRRHRSHQRLRALQARRRVVCQHTSSSASTSCAPAGSPRPAAATSSTASCSWPTSAAPCASSPTRSPTRPSSPTWPTRCVRLIATERYGLYHLTNAGYCSRHEYAARILALAGRGHIPVEPITLADYPRASAPPPFWRARQHRRRRPRPHPAARGKTRSPIF